jgi:hypothetical protein
VIGANGSLTGYGGGLPRKRWLLEHEGVVLKPASGRRLMAARFSANFPSLRGATKQSRPRHSGMAR